MRHEGPDTEVVATRGSEPFASASSPPLHARVFERFEVGRCLGTGTFGAVYEARERAGGTKVALKKLGISDPGAVYAFKQEFRALADVAHENLVRLDELFSIDGELYLTMELVEGESFLDWVRPGTARTGAEAHAVTTRPLADTNAEPSTVRSGRGEGAEPESGRRSRPAGAANVGRLTDAVRQLALGVLAIHRANKLHRDLKPSNVLCTPSGRVVILDFGLVAPFGPRRERRVVGTPAYMSPEQAQGLPLGPPSDWYSVGVMLYEALTGELPIDGDVRELMLRKQAVDAPDPRARVDGVPDALAELCLGLLDRAPATRATGAGVLRATGAPADLAAEPEIDDAPIIGREHHLAALEDAFATSCGREAVTVLLHGTSGMGKSALCRRFLDRVVEAHGAVVLEGRCYERELMPFKALDPLVDALADYLGGLGRDEVAALLPPDVPALLPLFPVLRRVPAIAASMAAARHPPVLLPAEPAPPPDARASDPGTPDPQEARRRAAIALRRLLSRIVETVPLVLVIDDMQWGDADSASLLLDLLAPPAPPRLLLIAGYRSEDAAGVHFAAALKRRMERAEPVGDVRELWVGPLGPREARTLARALFATAGVGPDEEPAPVAEIARESGGSPFFVHELSRHVRRHGGEGAAVSLGDVLRRRIEKLPEPSARLLSVIAVAGRPIGALAAERAAGVGAAGALSILRAERLVKVRGGLFGGRAVEPFHDRIREAVVAGLSPDEAARHNLALAVALTAEGTTDPEALLVHFEAGGDAARARLCAEAAAAHAEEALAFDRAAALYRRALDGAPEPLPLQVKLATALANAGRGAEAGRVYLEAAAAAPAGEALDLRRRAAEQLLRAGHVDEGLAAVREVLEAVRLQLPESPARAFASLVYRRAQLSLRGLGFEERAGAATPEDLTRIDVCWSVGNGLSGVDIVRGADFQARHLLYALRAGDPYRIARALASEALFASMEGGPSGPERAEKLLGRAAEIAERIRHPHARAWTAGARAGGAYYEQRFGEAVALSERAVTLFRRARGDNAWELGSIVCWFLLPSFWFLGRLEELSSRLPAYLKEAEDVGALYALTSLHTLMVPRVRFAEDRPVEARRESEAAIGRWSQHHGWHAQHFCAMYTRAHAALYMGDGAMALEEVEKSARDLSRSLLHRVETVRVDATYLRGSARVAAAARGSEGARLLRAADKDARALQAEERPYTRALGHALAASVALARGKLERAAALYAAAAGGFEALEMALHAAAMRWREGEVVLGEEGRAKVDRAGRWMNGQGVVRPDRLVAMLAPIGG